jgi:hypothetical protein
MQSINVDQLNLVAARSMYLESLYERCYDYLKQVNGSRVIDPEARDFAEQLIAEIVRLEAEL